MLQGVILTILVMCSGNPGYKYVPKGIMDRPKKGFAVPVMQWIKNGNLKEWAEELLNRNKIKREGILNVDVVEKTWENFKKFGVNETKIWHLLMFEEWAREKRNV